VARKEPEGADEATEALAWSVRGAAPKRLQGESNASVNFLRVPRDRRRLS
jgi:hypothetical protein